MARIVEIRVNKRYYEELIELELEKKKLTARIEELRELLAEPTRKVGRVRIEGYTIESVARSKYTYSSKVASLKGLLKARQAYEQERGIAKVDKTSYSIRITEIAS